MSIEIIVACGKSADGQLIIGANGKLPWNVPGELKHFRQKTIGHTVIMGRKTYESLPIKPLPQRKNIIFTRQIHYDAPGCEITNQRMPILRTFRHSVEKCFIIGGAETYRSFYPWASVIHFSMIDGTYEGDTYFPFSQESLRQWTMIMTEAHDGWKEIIYGRVPTSK